MLSKFKLRVTEKLAPIGKFIGKKFTPNQLTFLGLIFGLCAFLLIFFGKIILGAIFVLLSGVFDLLDGLVARTQRMATNFGGFLDSVFDRYVDILIFIALGLYGIDWLIVAIAMSGALLVSYTRARAEKFIEKCDVGIAERGERMIILFVAMISGYTYEGLLIIAILSHITAIHRIIYTYQKSKFTH
ncbi:MAG: CDP-alcohol phosphatidyltransferase family protein [Archaeoglobaceae archaeon]|nr:CDP-alcohol phosphatidyltransferase family protein [Archaeoglobaceae archaeon]MDW8117750.1 CDP-alcohol phosphatidyltransferase family protein [Archaeoglobaceae archaeon]